MCLLELLKGAASVHAWRLLTLVWLCLQSFSLERAMARMQPRLERLSHLWGESKQRARRRLRELVRSEACADELNLAPQQAPGPPAGPASSALSGPSITPGLQHMPAGPASTLVVHGEDAVFGHDGLLRVSASHAAYMIWFRCLRARARRLLRAQMFQACCVSQQQWASQPIEHCLPPEGCLRDACPLTVCVSDTLCQSYLQVQA